MADALVKLRPPDDTRRSRSPRIVPRLPRSPRACASSRAALRVLFELDEVPAHLTLQALGELEQVVPEGLLHVDGALDQRAGDDDVGPRLDGLLRRVGRAPEA